MSLLREFRSVLNAEFEMNKPIVGKNYPSRWNRLLHLGSLIFENSDKAMSVGMVVTGGVMLTKTLTGQDAAEMSIEQTVKNAGTSLLWIGTGITYLILTSNGRTDTSLL